MCYVNVKILLIHKKKFFRPFQSFLFLILENTPLNAYQKPGQQVYFLIKTKGGGNARKYIPHDYSYFGLSLAAGHHARVVISVVWFKGRQYCLYTSEQIHLLSTVATRGGRSWIKEETLDFDLFQCSKNT